MCAWDRPSDWAIDGRRDSVAVTVVTASSPFAQRKVFPRVSWYRVSG
jgi:hypothetical protein